MTTLLWLVLGAAAADPDGSEAVEPSSEASPTPTEDDDIGTLVVLGSTPRQVADVPGAAAVLTAQDLARLQPLSGADALGFVSGVTVQSEDPVGLRANIGIRGLNPNRSRKVLVLEDGVPIALAPYGEPEMYYNPPIEDIERIEVVKGSGAVLFGPQTIGGVINYRTFDPPEALSVGLRARVGTWGLAQGMATVGDTVGQVGYRATALHQRFAGPRHLDLVRTDVHGKVQLRFRPDHRLTLKLGVYDEVSKATYLGLTTAQWSADPNGSYAEHDRFAIRRYAVAATHGLLLTPRVTLQTRVYGHVIDRRWRRQDFDRDDLGYDYERVVDGTGTELSPDDPAAARDGSAIWFRDTTTHRDRVFTVAGIEPRLVADWDLGPTTHLTTAGFRVHTEHARDQRVVGAHPEAISGDITWDAERTGTAVAAYLLDRIGLAHDVVQISPGVRVESLWTRNRVLRDEVGGTVTDLDPGRGVPGRVTAVLPGIGAAVRMGSVVTAFTGVHRGFAPPRTKDAISGDGAVVALEAEHSWNAELGVRALRGDWLYTEVSGFGLWFTNQVIAPNEAGGAVADTTVNGGASLHAGVEGAARIDLLHPAGVAVGLPLSLNATFVHATFGEGWGAALKGQRLPYAPVLQLSAALGLTTAANLDLQIKASYVSDQYADRVQTVDASADGLIGRIGPYTLLDATATFRLPRQGLRLTAAMKNLLNSHTFASRAPRGIQPGLPRHLFVELGWDLP